MGNYKKKGNYVKGVLDGEYVEYYEEGLIRTHAYYREGLYDGIMTTFFTDKQLGNACMQIEFENNVPVENCMIISNQDGLWCKIRLDDHTPIYETPSIKNKKTEYVDGVAWPYYNYNGIVIAMTTSPVKDYGKYYRASFIVTNNTIFPFDMDPAMITASIVDKKGNEKTLKIYSSQEYMKKVDKKNKRNIMFAALNGALSAANAGYSSSTTTYGRSSTSKTTSYNDAATTTTYGSYGRSSTSKTTSYNGAAAYQAQVIESERLASYSNALFDEAAKKEAEYLKITTVYPGQTIKGYINIEKKKGVKLVVNVNINDAVYTFPWKLK